MSDELVLLNFDGDVAIVTLNAPSADMKLVLATIPIIIVENAW